jgi:hypothetical protein
MKRLPVLLAAALLLERPAPAESDVILSKYSKISLDVVNAMGRCVYGLDLDPKLLQAPLDVALRYGYLERPVAAAEIMWTVPK